MDENNVDEEDFPDAYEEKKKRESKVRVSRDLWTQGRVFGRDF